MKKKHTSFDNPFFVLGPCSIESSTVVIEVADELKKISEKLRVQIIYKSSFDKANRTAINSFRGIGILEGLELLGQIRQDFELLTLTDIHLPDQAVIAAEYVDILQIPALLCRQTDLLVAAGKTGLPINIKKGQFMSPRAMKYAVEKVHSTGNNEVFLTERGTFFGFGDIVVDFRNLLIMREYAPVIFDATHSVQQPSTGASQTSGNRMFVAALAKAAAAFGVDGFFLETHPDPDNALSDGPNMIHLGALEELIREIISVWRISNQ